MNYSLSELKLLARGSTPSQINLELLFANSHQSRLALIYRAMDWIIQEHCKTRQARFERDEDGLTIDVISSLVSMGFDASHDTQYGGHVDIVIEMADDFLWIAEAKIHGSYDWLLKGFQQLDTRYTTGLPGQDAGMMLIYCKNKNAKSVIDEYISRLRNARNDVKIQKDRDLVYSSEHTHSVSGLDFRIRHTIMPLHFDPQDRA